MSLSTCTSVHLYTPDNSQHTLATLMIYTSQKTLLSLQSQGHTKGRKLLLVQSMKILPVNEVNET